MPLRSSVPFALAALLVPASAVAQQGTSPESATRRYHELRVAGDVQPILELVASAGVPVLLALRGGRPFFRGGPQRPARLCQRPGGQRFSQDA